MTTTTDNDLKALKDFIGEQFKQVNREIGKLNGEVGKLNGEVSKLNGEVGKLNEEVGKLKGNIDTLDQNVNELRVDISSIKTELTGNNKRLENLEFTNRGIFIAIVAGLTVGLVKIVFTLFPTP